MSPSSDQPSARNPNSGNRAFDDPGANDPTPQRAGRTMRAVVDQVRRRAGLERDEEAERVVRATMHKLGARISSGQARDLAAVLPPELGEELTNHGTRQATSVDKHELIDQISAEIHSVDAETVEEHVAVVLHTVRQWAPDTELDDTLAQLPPQLAALFG